MEETGLELGSREDVPVCGEKNEAEKHLESDFRFYIS